MSDEPKTATDRPGCVHCGAPLPTGLIPKSIGDENRERAAAGKPPAWAPVFVRCEKCGENAIRPKE